MARVIILGSSNAIPSKGHENTHFIIVGEERTILVDCSGTPTVRLEQAGVELHSLTDVIVTHFHPDHAAGLPLLLMDMWLLGRVAPLNIYGLRGVMSKLKKLMDFCHWGEWPALFPVSFYPLPKATLTPVLECAEMSIKASPVQHIVPTIGLRIECRATGRILAYSCDTEPCEQTVELAAGADILIHEATGAAYGHSSAEQAGEIAAKAGVKKLYLIHYPTGRFAQGDLISRARQAFDGEIELAIDFLTIDF